MKRTVSTVVLFVLLILTVVALTKIDSSQSSSQVITLKSAQTVKHEIN